jgi:hypothetical protein
MKKARAKNIWAAIHWLGAIHRISDDEKFIRKFCRTQSPNPKLPIYYAMPIYGIKSIECDKCSGKGRLVAAVQPNKN